MKSTEGLWEVYEDTPEEFVADVMRRSSAIQKHCTVANCKLLFCY